jgi:SAM-dependent methyltransferase
MTSGPDGDLPIVDAPITHAPIVDARGFAAVDAQPDPSALVAGMDATAQWPAVRQLRAWEQERLALGAGDALLDVGCGIGDVARSSAALVVPGGRVVGIDTSDAMLTVARARAAIESAETTFRVGDALAIDEPDASFDACRSERVLQWLPDMDAAVGEMLRVLRPAGRCCLTDTDWRTFAIDLPDPALCRRVATAMVDFRGAGAAAGGRLLNLCRDHQLLDAQATAATHVWSAWDPDSASGPPGLFPLRNVLPNLVGAGALDADDARRFVQLAEHAGRNDRFYMSVSMTSVFGRTPY